MKKFIYSPLIVIIILFLSACNSNEDLPTKEKNISPTNSSSVVNIFFYRVGGGAAYMAAYKGDIIDIPFFNTNKYFNLPDLNDKLASISITNQYTTPITINLRVFQEDNLNELNNKKVESYAIPAKSKLLIDYTKMGYKKRRVGRHSYWSNNISSLQFYVK